MLLAARSESVNVVFPWSTCPQVVIFRVACESIAMMERSVKVGVAEFVHDRTTCHFASSNPATSATTARDDDCPTVWALLHAYFLYLMSFPG